MIIECEVLGKLFERVFRQIKFHFVTGTKLAILMFKKIMSSLYCSLLVQLMLGSW